MTWILLATAGQFLNAVVAVLDKYIVSDEKAMPRPFVYAFYSCLLTSSWVLVFLLPFIPGLSMLGIPSLADVQKPSIQVVGMAFLAAYTFFMALVSMFDALKHADASDVMPAIGGVSALATFLLSYLFFGMALEVHVILGVLLLASGTFLLSHVRLSNNTSLLLHVFHAGLFFGLHYIVMKGLFLETNFADGFFWSRVCFVLFALSLLLVPTYYEKITQQTKTTSKRTGAIVIAAKVLAGIAAFMLLKATDQGDVAVVQALDGLKFVFIILLGVVIGRFTPYSAGENEFDLKTLIRKTLYIGIITLGFVVLFL
jgi:uncharacterized membrane protein